MSFRDDFEKIIEPIQLNQNMPKEDFNAKSLAKQSAYNVRFSR